MKNEIISILYNRLQIYIIALIKYIYLTIFFILKVNLSINSHDKILSINNSKLAFNLNILYLYKTNNQKIEKIEIDTLNNLIVKHIAYNCPLSLQKQISNYKIEIINIKKTIDLLKNSGFIKNINLKLVKKGNKKYVILHLYTNPILKKIIIFNYKSLKIPNEVLRKIFQPQIGLPKNYIKLKKSINKIYSWYKLKGFEWIHIKLVNDEKSEHLSLEIVESTIVQTEFISISNNNLSKNIQNIIENRILQELHIKLGNTLNIKKIESGINYLKDIKLINECTYKVMECNKGLKIILKYKLFKSQMECIYRKNVKENKISIKNNIKNNISNFYSHYKYILTNISNHIILLNKYLTITYTSYYPYLDREKKIIFNIKILKNFPSMNIKLLHPSIKISKNIYGNFITYLYHKINQANSIYPLHALNILKTNKRSNSIVNKGVKILFKHYLYKNIYLEEEINKIYYCTIKNSIYLKRCITNYKLQDLRNQNKYKLTAFKKIIKQQVISLNILLKYNPFYLSNKLKSSKSLLLHLISNISLPFTKNQAIYSSKYPCKYIYFQYHQTFIIPKFLKLIKINYHSLVMFLEIYLDTNQNFDSAIIKRLLRYQNYLNFNLYIPKQYRYYYYPSYLYHIEYNTFIHKYLSLYIFSNYSYNLYSNLYNNLSSLKDLHKNNTNIGYGVQINLPIQKIPPIRIEYGINNKEKNFLQMRAYSKYTKYYI
uniref:Uncharacterized protein n=1 Tax=Leiomenia cribrosa TaxID=217483 RepID=A0A4D6WXB2_9FLOR|nr:hypothetical protein [Leiomenia cribrosa]